MCLPLWGQAANCTLVTSSLRLVDKRSRSWLQRSSAQLRGVTRTRMKRRGFVKKEGSAAEEDSSFDIFWRTRLLKFHECFTQFLTVRCPHCTYCESRVAVWEWQHVTATSYLWQAGCKWCHFQQRYPRWCHSFGSTIEKMPTGLLGGVCKGCKEDRDGLRNWENACHEGVGGQCVRKSFLMLVYAK